MSAVLRPFPNIPLRQAVTTFRINAMGEQFRLMTVANKRSAIVAEIGGIRSWFVANGLPDPLQDAGISTP